MKRGLSVWAIGSYPLVELADAEIDALRDAISVVTHAVDMEQKFDIFVSNFVEHEEQLASSVLSNMYRGIRESNLMFDQIGTFSRRLQNLLSSARGYIDQGKRHALTIIGSNPVAKDQIDKLFGDQYDTKLGYRVMEALRNYSQHRGYAIHGVSYDDARVDVTRSRVTNERNESNIALTISLSQLEEDGKFKASILDELKGLDDWIDIKQFVREYVEALALVHKELRALIDIRVNESIVCIKDAHERYKTVLGRSSPGLSVVQRIDEQRGKREFPVVDHNIDFLQHLRSRLGYLVHSSGRSVSTSAIPPKQRR